MGDSKNDDFWKSSKGDDFWNKPVVEDDWFEKEEKADYSGLSADFQTASDAFKKENPYIKTHVHQDFDGIMESSENESPDDAVDRKKRIHIHTIICLTAIFIAILSMITAFLLVKTTKRRAFAAATELTFEVVEVDNSFTFNENNDVYLEDNAYTIVTAENFRNFPEDIKLIAVYAEVTSDDYIKDSAALKDIYIGFNEAGREAYKKPVRSDLISSYVYGFGFRDSQIFRNYGIGNGSDCAGYYFFFVPSDVEEITLYMERKRIDSKIAVIDKIYKKDMAVLPENEELTEQLAQRR